MTMSSTAAPVPYRARMRCGAGRVDAMLDYAIRF